ncbi:hypothetical protein AVEN_217608-1 [Araneus ventricosus]|uniref:RNase H type-1 domain-containing protein n=1 Tax=Araneus ventricosus TaxID=182803 RepID=A0A4Y2FF41_ARAVE|nr:hypothetical protein AVEN_217608-1 [Araneus ventricosus]
MIAIDMALDFVLEHQLFGEIWILSDSRSVVQYLDNWRDVTGGEWISVTNSRPCAILVFFIYNGYHHMPGTSIHFKGYRKDQTALARLASGHLKTLRFSHGDKKFNICTKCNMIEATSQHLLDCVALVYDDLLKRPDFNAGGDEGGRPHGSDLIQNIRIRKKKNDLSNKNNILPHMLLMI